jgi:hypothetical protein
MSQLALGQVFRLGLAKAELNSPISIPLGRSNLRHIAWPGFQNGDRDNGPIVPKDLGHTDLSP